MSLANDVKISQIQDCFRAAGFQWQEHIFNDDMVKYGNCMIEFTQDKSPHAFSSFPRPMDTVGWGRFDRSTAWEMAYQWLLLHKDKKVAMDTKCTQCDSLDIYDGQCMDCGNFLDGINYVQIVKCVYDENKNFPNQFESVGGNYI